MSDSVQSTVMGPGSGSAPGIVTDILAPPSLLPTTDKFKWRKQVALWATTVERFAKGGDERAKGILNALGLTLLNALDSFFASKVERAITAGIITLDSDEGNDEANQAKQQETIQEIVDMVAKDTPTDGIRHLVQMMRNVYSCVRKSGESTAMYARRFQALALALDYLNHCDTSAADQDTQNFAMLLLENAKVPSSVYSTVVTQLVSTATSRTDTKGNKVYVIGKDKINTVTAKVTAIIDADGVDKDAPRPYEVHTADLKAIREIMTNAIKANERHAREDRSSFRVTLDDAVEVLSDLKVEDSENKNNTFGQKHISYSTMLGKRSYQQEEEGSNREFGKYPRDKRQKQQIPNGQGPKANSRCKACKQPNHWYRDPECIYNVIRTLIEGKDVDTNVILKQPANIRELFKAKDGGFKNKVSVNDIVEVIGESSNEQSSDHCDKVTKAYFQ